MEPSLQIREDILIPGHELWATASLSGGPGGQHVNKVSSRITLYWQVVSSQAVTEMQRERILLKLKHRISSDGVLQVTVDDHRSQHRNREEARLKLADLVRNALTQSKKRLPTRATVGSKRRRLDAKRRTALTKQLRQSPKSHSE